MRRSGFSIPELSIVMAIMISLYLLGTSNLFSPQRTNELRTTEDTLISDMTSQQARAMTGDTASTGTNSSYGVYFQQDRYTLFKGVSYSAGDANNFTVTLGPNVRFSSINFPNDTLVYAQSSGEAAGYVSGQDTVVLEDAGEGVTRTIHVNNYGVIDSVN